jgi:hypothetical protein
VLEFSVVDLILAGPVLADQRHTQIARTQAAPTQQHGNHVSITQTHPTDDTHEHVQHTRDWGGANGSISPRRTPEEAQPCNLPNCTSGCSPSMPRKRKGCSNGCASAHRGPIRNATITADDTLNRVHQGDWSATKFNVHTLDQHACNPSQASLALTLEDSERLLTPAGVVSKNTVVAPLPSPSAQTMEAPEHTPAVDYHCSLSDTPYTEFLTTNWSPSLLNHAAAAGVLAAGDSWTDDYPYYPNSIYAFQGPSFDNGTHGIVDTVVPIGSTETISTALTFQYYNDSDVLATDQIPSIDSPMQNRTRPAEHQQRQVLGSTEFEAF